MHEPTIISITSGVEHQTDLLSYDFNKNRTIHLNCEVNSESASSIVKQLHYLNSKSQDDIILVINSPGGNVSDGLVIYDTIKYQIDCDVATVSTGIAASMGAFLLSAGTVGKRYATQNSGIMIHQPLGGAQGQASDIELVAKRILKTKDTLTRLLAQHTSQPVKKIAADMDRDRWFSAEEACEYGLIDHVGYPEF